MMPLERRLAQALDDAAARVAGNEGRLDAVVAHGARRRRLARFTAGATGLLAASVVAVGMAWAAGGGNAPPGQVPFGGEAPVGPTTTLDEPAGVVGTAPPATPAPDEAGEAGGVVGTAPPTTSPTGESDAVVGTSEPDVVVGTAPPTTSPTGESDVAVGTGEAGGVVGTVPPTTSPTGESDAAVGTLPPPVIALAACPAPGEASDDFGTAGDDNRVHHGIDIVAPRGTPVSAVARGTVALRTSVLAGNAVYLTAADGNLYVYAHLDRFAAGLVDGDAVGPGDPLGEVGDTGSATRPQLHFEIRPGGGGAVDPYDAVRAACG